MKQGGFLMEQMKVSVLYLGRLEFLKLQLIACEDETEMIRSPMVAILVQHPELGNILYDTGNSPLYSTEYTEDMLKTYPMAEFISIEDALQEKGLKPSDIDTIILSHMHFDHVGGLKYFRGTKAIQNVIVAEAELKNAYFSVMTGNGGAYIKSLFDLEDICFKPINETTQLAEDFTLFIQESHTPGVIGMILNTKHHGTLITTSDTIYTRESFKFGLPPGGNINKTQDEFFGNLERIKKLQHEYQATLLFGHDFDQIKDWSQKGWID
jgi:glyoxylase-like metal-dependent hydrolase (beta-lactamase superfamily II)